ncbi:NAD(P)H-dependent oxidoreductase [Pseudobutyrivibrio xylanivorans]|uniref:ACP phosphodiesterase n=1 Tax=Pseudobutyrivibrio xylanivorans TaxID=185007 RepID=A0A5P6VRC8_PSEXY|nr:NAD(P)H-dependent oxidoreductase [Pseudobutyrivibrio xylanivorans]QFJ54239.1 ACP phosphodiesterase [Pseudobutyrivibrio xylanivorans]
MTLFINACVREKSRTKLLSDALLAKLGDYEEVNLEDIDFPKTDKSFLKKRDSLIASHSFDNPMFTLARHFAEADTIVIAAPYWDLSFPAVLKQYIEHINVLGITFEYTPEGFPKGLCRANKLYYVMTAGGTYVPEEFAFGYIKSLAENFYGIKDVKLIAATGLDIYGADEQAILKDALNRIEKI